jgi:photosystem II stability/assembly factor-like uncharacterized protein
VDADTGWLFDEGSTQVTDDGGKTWSASLPLPFEDASSISGEGNNSVVNKDVAWVTWELDDQLYSFVTDDRGATWTKHALPAEHGRSIFGVSANRALMTGPDSGDTRTLVQTDNKGETWTDVGISFEFGPEIFFFDENRGLMLADSELRETLDGGRTWSAPVPFPRVREFSPVSATLWWTKLDQVYASTADAGKTWQPLAVEPPIPDVAVCGDDSIWIHANHYREAGTWIRSKNGGQTFELLDESFVTLACAEGSRVFAVSAESDIPDEPPTLTFVQSSDGGDTWSEVPGFTDFSIDDEAFGPILCAAGKSAWLHA